MAESVTPSEKDKEDPQFVGTSQGLFSARSIDREAYLVRARRLSRLSVASLFRAWGATGSTDDVVPWQSLGANGLNTLAAKLTIRSFPPNLSFVNHVPSKRALDDLKQYTQDPDKRGALRAVIDAGLVAVDQEFVDCMDEDGDRVQLFDTMRRTLCGGTHGLKFKPYGTLQSIPLERFINVRAGDGELIEWIVEDPLTWESAPQDVRDMAAANGYKYDPTRSVQVAPLKVYTRGCLYGGHFDYYQEVMGKIIPATQTTVAKEACPYLFVPLILQGGEHYGRSYLEDMEGDLQNLDAMWQFLLEGGASIAQLKWLVAPGGVTSKKAFAEARNGDVLTGRADDVAAVRSEKGGDLQFIVSLAERLEQRLQTAFLMMTSIQRSGERVTAAEINRLGQELDEGTGGMSANLTTSLQGPFARIKSMLLQKAKRITRLPPGDTTLKVRTGDTALGRRQEAQTIDEFIATSVQALGPAGAQVGKYVSIGTYLRRGAANRSIDSEGLILSDAAVQASDQAAQQQALSHQVAPEVVKQGGQMLQSVQQQQQEPV